MDQSPQFLLDDLEVKDIKTLISRISCDPELVSLIRYGSSVKTKNYQDIDLCIVARKMSISVKKHPRPESAPRPPHVLRDTHRAPDAAEGPAREGPSVHSLAIASHRSVERPAV